MLILVRFLILNLLIFNLSNANSDSSDLNCNWDNKNNIPCIEISSLIPNSSNFSKSGINKTTITRKQIEESGAVDLVDLLKSIPDINITQSGPKGQQASIFIRGTGSNHTLVMINGIPINDQSTTQGLHDFGVDFIQTIQQIEVYPGSSATHFGTNAIGGAVNIILTGDYKDSFLISTDINSNYDFLGNKTFIYQDSSLNIKIGSVKNKTVSARGKLSDEKDGLKNYSTNINYEKFLSDNKRLHNTIYLRQTKSEYDNSIVNQTGYKADNKMAALQFGLENQIESNKDNYVFYFNIYDREYDERGTIDEYKSQVIGIKFDSSGVLNQKISYGLGSDYKYDWGNFENNGSYQASTKGHSDTLAIYSNLGWNIFQNSNLSVFSRSDRHKQVGTNNTYKVNVEQKFSNLILGTSYMSGLRNPTLYEMFGTDNYGYSGNIALKPEKSNTYEIYSNFILTRYLNVSIRAFKANIKNNIEYINNKYQNDNDNVDLNQSGVNSQLNVKFKDTKLNLYSSFLSAKKEDSSDQLRRPEKNYGINLSTIISKSLFGSFNLNINYNHYGKHFDTHSANFSTIEMDSTDIVDLKISKKFKNNDFFIKATNLLNETYQRPHGFNHENRIIKFGIKY